jgi:hypothetical protein
MAAIKRKDIKLLEGMVVKDIRQAVAAMLSTEIDNSDLRKSYETAGFKTQRRQISLDQESENLETKWLLEATEEQILSLAYAWQHRQKNNGEQKSDEVPSESLMDILDEIKSGIKHMGNDSVEKIDAFSERICALEREFASGLKMVERFESELQSVMSLLTYLADEKANRYISDMPPTIPQTPVSSTLDVSVAEEVIAPNVFAITNTVDVGTIDETIIYNTTAAKSTNHTGIVNQDDGLVMRKHYFPNGELKSFIF